MFLELGDKTQQGKERFLFFYFAQCLISNKSQIKQEMVVNWETRMLQWVIWRLLGVPDTDDVKQKNKP